MALQTRVLVSSIENLSDARYCAGMGVDMIGFDLSNESAAYIAPSTFKAITDWVSGVQFVGELPEVNVLQVQEMLASYPLDYLQLPSSADWATLADVGVPLICKVMIDASFNFESFQKTYLPVRQYIKWFVLEGKDIDMYAAVLETVTKIASQFPVLLGLGITPASIKNLINQSPIQGIVLKGSREIRPGFKDYNELADILEAIEIDE